MCFADGSGGVLVSIRLPPGSGELGHLLLLGVLPDFKCWSISSSVTVLFWKCGNG